MEYSVLTVALKDEGLEIIGRSADFTWLVVLLEDGLQGWVSAYNLNYLGDIRSLQAVNPPPIPKVGEGLDDGSEVSGSDSGGGSSVWSIGPGD